MKKNRKIYLRKGKKGEDKIKEKGDKMILKSWNAGTEKGGRMADRKREGSV